MSSKATKQVLREQIEALREQNARLMDEIRAGQSLRISTGETGSHTLGESETVLEAHRQATGDLQVELAESLERNQELDRLCSELHERVQRVTMEAELDKLRAVQDERSKWKFEKNG